VPRELLGTAWGRKLQGHLKKKWKLESQFEIVVIKSQKDYLRI
jgi:hypothetical protein